MLHIIESQLRLSAEVSGFAYTQARNGAELAFAILKRELFGNGSPHQLGRAALISSVCETPLLADQAVRTLQDNSVVKPHDKVRIVPLTYGEQAKSRATQKAAKKIGQLLSTRVDGLTVKTAPVRIASIHPSIGDAIIEQLDQEDEGYEAHLLIGRQNLAARLSSRSANSTATAHSVLSKGGVALLRQQPGPDQNLLNDWKMLQPARARPLM